MTRGGPSSPPRPTWWGRTRPGSAGCAARSTTPTRSSCSSAATTCARAPRSTPPRSRSWWPRNSPPADRNRPVGPARSSRGSVLFTTYNLLDLGADDSAAGAEHYASVAESIRALRTDVLAVQEICAPGLPAAGRLLLQLADDTGLRCLVPRPGGAGGDAAPALCPGSRGYHLGLLWRDGIEPVPGSFRSRNTDFWHALGWVTLDVGGPAVRHAVYHAPPFGRKIRAAQSEIVVASLAPRRPRTGGGRAPALVGADWNGESADRVRDPATGRWQLYEPGD